MEEKAILREENEGKEGRLGKAEVGWVMDSKVRLREGRQGSKR